MVQKDKVKELVGRGLGSYHTKALQQMNRIEKKNKEQNHKISILTNELDNDYLSKTEEGSVVSLEHSKEGMIYLDELQGNTLVNYCTDGAKELTLNGDIDVERTSVTLTEGVDNGLVDVMCEGNTLVNMFSGKISDLYGGGYRKEDDGYITLVKKTYGDCIHLKTDMYKPSTTYTLIVDVKENTLSSVANLLTDSRTYIKSTDGYIGAGKTGIFKIKFTTIDDFSTTTNNLRWGFYLSYAQLDKTTRGDITLKFILLEGDWTNKEIPQYFEGMKSVGQDNENGHKIEILSSKYKANFFVNSQCLKMNPNNVGLGTSTLMTDESEKYYRAIPDENSNVSLYTRLQKSEDFKFGEEYIISVMVRPQYDSYVDVYDNANTISTSNQMFARANEWTTISTKCAKLSSTDAFILISNTKNCYLDYKNLKMEKGNTVTSWMPSINDEEYQNWELLNKKEISLNEPLRGFENGKKDRFVKINNKWFTERNCRMRNSTEFTWQESGRQFENHYCVFVNGLGCKKDSKYLSTSYPYISDAYATYLDASYISNNSNTGYDLITLTIPKSKLTTVDIAGAREYLNNNPFDFMVELATPTYEEITDVELITYLDTTHISNNSTIPCNMKIQNSGYNAIIKPSTQYTVALDTNKSGTIGINLGGAKVTTTNNVATITTPATLTDDSLRLYGKYIKASKVRLLEGDKTNWIPSYFEGMQSSFEDKLQDDGTYKMEILSNNRNLLNLDILETSSTTTISKNSEGKLYFTRHDGGVQGRVLVNTRIRKGKRYNISFNATNIPSIANLIIYITDMPISNLTYRKIVKNLYLPNIGSNTYYGNFIAEKDGYLMFETDYAWEEIQLNDLQLIESEDYVNYIPHKSNKIQFSSIEPLRKWDRFVFKEGKLMIERNSGVKVFNGSEKWAYGDTSSGWNQSGNYKAFYTYSLSNTKKTNGESYTTYLPTTIGAYSVNSATSEAFSLGHANYELIRIDQTKLNELSSSGLRAYLNQNPLEVVYQLKEPIYEEIPFDMKKIILESYENGTLYFDTNIPPTSTVTYSGETPIVKSVKSNKIEVLSNTNDINDNIIPYLMDMDYRVVCIQLENEVKNISMSKMFGGAYEMLKRDIETKRYSIEEYKHRLNAYLNVNKLTEEEYNKLGDMLNE